MNRNPTSRGRACVPALLLVLTTALNTTAQAQTAARPDTVVITANPLRSAQGAAPVSVLAGEELVLRRGGSLGETLDGLPGVSSTWFGPNANRPVIRGLDGDRVRVLSNGGASLDASSLSYDHAVPIDPLIVNRIEVLRGPAALFHGGSAVGGVVNTLDNRIPRERATGVSGTAELRLGGADGERGGALVIDGGGAGSGSKGSNLAFAWHADAFSRQTADLRVPEHVPLQDGLALDATRRVRNSSASARGGALGGTLFFANGRVGLAADTYDSTYGVVAEPDITIRMKRDHLGLAAEWAAASGAIRALRVNANLSDYVHEEIEGSGAVGTRFASRGQELRLEAEHAPLGPLRGVIGVQREGFDFSALGEEAFVPSTDTRKTGVFLLEELAWQGGTTSAGLRLERVVVGSDGDADPAAPKFGAPAQRRYTPRSASLAHVLPLGPRLTITGNLSATERAPTYFELYANGVHAATAVYERGDLGLAMERAASVDLALQWKADADVLRLGLFASRFARFIALDATGDVVDDTGAVVPAGTPDSVPLFAFSAVRARLSGVEIEGRKRLLERPWTLDITARLDATRGVKLSSGEPLPRVAPWRTRLGLESSAGRWNGRIEVDRVARQSRVPSTDQPTAGYTMLSMALSQRFKLGSTGDALWFARLTNLGDRLAYSASSYPTIRGLSPLPGRALKVGMQIGF